MSRFEQIPKRKHTLHARLTNKKVKKMALPPERPARRKYLKIGTNDFCPSSGFASRTSPGRCIRQRQNFLPFTLSILAKFRQPRVHTFS